MCDGINYYCIPRVVKCLGTFLELAMLISMFT